MTMFPATFKPNLIILPFKASACDTGQPLTFSQVNTLCAQGQAEFIDIERSRPGAPETSGWTIFERTLYAYVHTGAPFFEAESDARRHMREACVSQPELGREAAPDRCAFSYPTRRK
jgi:hypothetical protein